MRAKRVAVRSSSLLGVLAMLWLVGELANADELTRMIQKDLVSLGYSPGAIDGKMSVDTEVAISKFQAQNGLKVTGKGSPQLAGILSARVDALHGGSKVKQAAPPAAAQPLDASTATSTKQKTAPAHCVKQTVQKAAQKTRSLDRLVAAGGRLLGRFGHGKAEQTTNQVTGVADDTAAAADAASDLSSCDQGSKPNR